MARRSRTRKGSKGGISAGQIIGIAAAVAGFLIAAFLMFKIVAGDLLSGGSKNASSSFVVGDYTENSLSLRGNVYHVVGTVEERLGWNDDHGRLISLDVTDDSGSSPVPILIPIDFSQVNIDRGAEMGFTVRVDRGGLLIAEAIDDN
jgi:hypothetical protein